MRACTAAHRRRRMRFLVVALLLAAAITGSAQARYLPVIVDQADLSVLTPQAWEQNGDIVVSWGLYNPLPDAVIPGVFTAELRDAQGIILARTSGSHLLTERSVLGPQERGAEYAILAGMAGQGSEVRLRLATRREAQMPVRPALRVIIRRVHGYLGDRWELEVTLRNEGVRPVTATEAALQLVFYDREYGVIGTQALDWFDRLEPGAEQQLRLLTGPVMAAWLPEQIKQLTAYGPRQLQVEMQLE